MGATGENAEPPIMELLTTPRRTAAASSERGAILVLTALVMMLMLMIAAFATDVGAWYRQGQEQTRVADLGSLNGIQAYEQFRRAEFNLNNYDEWSDFTAAERKLLDFESLEEATNAVMDLLAVQGHPTTVTATNPDTSGTYVGLEHKDPAPGGTPASSWITFVTNDGLTVTVTRNPDLTITVTVEKEATQYFSHIIADAPTIERSSTATLSNCGAICDVPITINPPFIGFSGSGSGDGFRPMIYAAAEEVWAVNHHRRTGATNGEIVCMNMTTRSFCADASGGTHNLGNYETHNRPAEEYLNPSTGKIYFTARDWSTNKTGLVCFDTNTTAYCGFQNLFNQDFSNRWPAIVNATGPWVYNNKMYVMGQQGRLKCVNFSMNGCGAWNTDAQYTGALPAINPGTPETTFINGEQIGSKVYFTHILNGSGGVVFQCWDLASSNNCGWANPVQITSLTGRTDFRQTFLSYNTAQSPNGICVADVDRHINRCVALDGGSNWSIGGLSGHLAQMDVSWGGDTFSWEGRRTFFAGGRSNIITCWNWDPALGPVGECGEINYGSATADAVYPYAFTQQSPKCIMGLGDKSVYYSFKPSSLTPCVDTTVDVDLRPCKCADATTDTWGTLIIPEELRGLVDQLHGTLYDDATGNVIPPHIGVDLLASNGELDLSALDPSVYTDLTLVLDVQAKVDLNGIPLWTNPIVSNLELVVQPTLTD